jgi:hypothetical protein
MAGTLKVSEGQIVDEEGNRIATLTDLADSERFTALEERVSALENAARPPTPTPPMPGTVVEGEQVMEPIQSPPGSSQEIHFLSPEEQAGAPVEPEPPVEG